MGLASYNKDTPNQLYIEDQQYIQNNILYSCGTLDGSLSTELPVSYRNILQYNSMTHIMLLDTTYSAKIYLLHYDTIYSSYPMLKH